MTMLAWNSDPKLKAAILRSIARHRRADTLRAGAYHNATTGAVCAVGCNVDAVRRYIKRDDLAWDDHAGLSRAIGMPIILLQLQDRLFERMINGDRLGWPGRFARAIEPGADLSRAWARFAVKMLTRVAARRDPGGVVKRVRDLYSVEVAGGSVSRTEWSAAADAAAAAAAAAASYAAAAADAAAAYAAAGVWDLAFAALDRALGVK